MDEKGQSRTSYRLQRTALLAFLGSTFLAAIYLEIFGSGWILSIGSYQLWATDLACLSSFPALTIVFTRPRRHLTLETGFLCLYLFVQSLVFLRGLSVDVHMTFLWFRPYALFMLLLVVLSFYPTKAFNILSTSGCLIAAGVAISLIVYLRAFTSDLLFVSPQNYSFYVNEGRYIQKGGAQIISASIVMGAFLLIRWKSQSVWRNILLGAVPFMLVALIISQQRTATVAGLVGLIMLLVFERSATRRIRAFVVISIISLFLVYVLGSILVLGFDQYISNTPHIVQTAFSRENNLTFREDLWSGYLYLYGSWNIVDKLIGTASPFAIFAPMLARGVRVSLSPHSQYIGALVSVGLIGAIGILGAVICSFLRACAAAFRGISSNELGLSPALVASLGVLLIIFGFTYEWQYEQGLLVGLIVAAWPSAKDRQLVITHPLARRGDR